MDRIIGEVSSKREHGILADKESRLVNQVTKLHEELGRAEEELGVVHAKMALRFCTEPVANEKICIIADP